MVVLSGVTDRELFAALMADVDVDAVLAAATWERPAWQAQGACRARPDVNWFPTEPRDAAPARAICAVCPARLECVTQALEFDELGVWGGTTEIEREHARAAGWGAPELLENLDRVDDDAKVCPRCGELRAVNGRGYCTPCAAAARAATRDREKGRQRDSGAFAREQARLRELGLKPLAPWATV